MDTGKIDTIFTLFHCVSFVNRCRQKLSASLEKVPPFEEIVVEDVDEKVENEIAGQKGSDPERLLDSSDHEDDESTTNGSTNSLEPSDEENIDEPFLDEYLASLSQEFKSDEELTELPEDNIKVAFSYFMVAKFQMPDVDETPLGRYLQKLQDDKYEDLTTYELQQMLDMNLKENKMLKIQNAVFEQFLERNDPRYEKENTPSLETSPELPESDNLKLTSAEMVDSKVLLPDLENYGSESQYLKALTLLSRVVEHEIKEMYKSYEVELNRFNCRMKQLGAVQNSLQIHRDKLNETVNLLNALIIKKKKRKIAFELEPFAEFLKAAIKQDQQDLRRFRVLTYEYKKKTATIQKNMKSRDSIRKVDLDLYKIKCKQLKAKLKDLSEEFLQLKKIFDSYQTKLDKFQKRLNIEKQLNLQYRKTRSKKLRTLEIQRVCFKTGVESLFELFDKIEAIHKSI